MSRWLISLVCLLVGLVGCYSASAPEARVLGVHDGAHGVVFVQVTNPANHPLKLTKLEYSFAADGASSPVETMPLERDVPAGAAVVVEVPIDADPSKAMTLQGKLTATLDEIVRTFPVEAQIAPH